jgi:uncharacterized membrane protein
MPFLQTLFGKLITTFFLAMVPVIELRGAIPYGVALGLDPWVSCGVSILGNLVPVPFIILLVRRVFEWLRKGRFWGPKIEALEKRAHLKGQLVRKYRLPGLIILVGIPLPGTGAWTGALVAVVLGIRLREALPAILAGLLIAGGITTAVTYGVFAVLT